MATIRHERHLRYILLLGEGGTLVLQEILKREIKNSGKTLEELLIGYKSRIKQRTFSESFLKVYPQTGIPDETTWDISLLALIILQLFGGSLMKDECQEIENIRKTRNNLAHTFSLSMDENEYDDSRKKLAATLLKLSDGLGRFIQDKCQNFIKQFDTGPIDIHAAIERVKEFSRYDEHISKALWKITKNIADVKYQISDVQMDVKEVLRRMYLGDKEFSTFQGKWFSNRCPKTHGWQRCLQRCVKV
ncbi:uncharacterized protein LOC128553200 [Mercenaria mercenaria]|uniref:uncharacterized protein LOC128553200 n=1 Tax=Mercenaria mercenaria TaxID=6596 RepID=UPI00234E5AFF|nr:uncharacterized protein LOC128553200 [Mercenaria mercenaria]